MPSATTLANWVEQTRPGFVFAIKGHMRITHVLRLKNAGEATDVFLRSIDPLRSARRLGPVLFQLPPHLKCDAKLLTDFLALLPPDLRFALEFRHNSWLTEEVYGLAARPQGVAVRGGVREVRSPGGDHGRFRLLSPAQARLHG
jgi:uncharacterized protein YecE (DUF72 family)